MDLSEEERAELDWLRNFLAHVANAPKVGSALLAHRWKLVDASTKTFSEGTRVYLKAYGGPGGDRRPEIPMVVVRTDAIVAVPVTIDSNGRATNEPDYAMRTRTWALPEDLADFDEGGTL